MKKTTGICLLFLAFINLTYAQTIEIERLKTLLKKTKNKKEKVNILNDLVLEAHYTTEQEKCKIYLEDAGKLAKKIAYQKGVEIYEINQLILQFINQDEVIRRSKAINYKRGEAYGLGQKGILLNLNDDYEEARKYFIKQYEICQEIKWKKMAAWSRILLGFNYTHSQNLDKALPLFLESQKIALETGDQRLLFSIYYAKADFYLEQSNYSKAYEMIVKGQNIPKKDNLGPGYSNFNLLLGRLYREQYAYKKSLEFYHKAIITNENFNTSMVDFVFIHLELGETYALYGDTLQAVRFINNALENSKQQKNNRGLIRSKANLALYSHKQNYEVIIPELIALIQNFEKKRNPDYLYFRIKLALLYTKNQQFNLAEETLNNVIKDCQDLSYPKREMEAYQAQIDLYESWENYNKAHETNKKYHILNEKILGAQKATEIAEVNFEKTLIQQENENKLLEQEKNLSQAKLKQSTILIQGSLAVVSLLLILAYILWRNNRLKHKTNQQLLDKNHKIARQKVKLEETLKELKDTQTQLIQAEKMASLGQLTAGVAHEINNPFNFITANVATLKENIQEILKVLPEYQKINRENYNAQLNHIEELKEELWFDSNIDDIPSLISGIEDGSQRVATIINGLKVYTHQDGKEMNQVDIHQLLDAALIVLSSRYKDRITIHKEYGEIPAITCFPGELEQVITNILANAIEAITDKGAITLKTSLKNEGKSLSMQVSDTGTGMSEETQKHIFEPFFTTKDVGKGTGLGLSIAHSIVEKHGGSIEVESEVGEGTTFRVIVPLRDF